MTVTCAKGHTSDTTDYCDVCGAPIVPDAAGPGGPAGSASSPSPDTSVASAAVGTARKEGAAGFQTCGACGTDNPVGHRFCENCGADTTAFAPSATPPPTADPAPAEASSPAPAQTAQPAQSEVPSGWEAVAVADREVYDRVEAPEVGFPLLSPTRRFVLAGDRVTIGRRSASRGIIPDIDLSAAPEDAGVSHLHATLVFQPEGTWAVLDAGSANGTYLNDQTDPIVRNELVPLIEGDRVHIGAWTTITLRRSGSA